MTMSYSIREMLATIPARQTTLKVKLTATSLPGERPTFAMG